jgi:acyl-CoA synthetase (AMP-forming)/AMP-acid ligase II
VPPLPTVAAIQRFGRRVGNEAYYLRLCFRSGLLGIDSPRTTADVVLGLKRFGMLGGAPVVAAARHPERTAVIDEGGSITYRQLDDRVNALANAWLRDGMQPGDSIAVLIRNHAGFLQTVFAAAKCGARILLMNTGFSGPQIREVLDREGADMLVYDEEYEQIFDDLTPRLGRWRAWLETREEGPDTLAALIASAPTTPPPPPRRNARLVILTSGTTGAPKGADREVPASLAPVGGPLSRVPFRARGVTQLCAPLFHALGFTQLLLAVGLGATIVLQRRFDPSAVLESLERHSVDTMVVVPVMLQRMVALDNDPAGRRDFSKLRIIYVSGSQLGADLCRRATEMFGGVLYNLYGSTEIAFATIATPADLAIAPNSVGKVVRGAVVKVLDDSGHELPPGRTGRVFVGSAIQFEGYTGGGDKERLGELMSSGDVGHFDSEGRLYIDGRDDEMIISGGENVYPAEVEELLGGHTAIVEVAAIGVDDDRFGQRLRVFVVLRSGTALTAEQVRDYVRANLAGYKVPRDVEFCDELPRNPTGKVLKRDLATRR